jgi:membrane protease YdiL (CAAX protease family)
VDEFFPADIILTLNLLLFFLLVIKKFNRTQLLLKINWRKNSLCIILIISFISIAALATWFFFQIGNPYEKFLPEVPLCLLIPMGFGFAFINAIYEECLFRSFLLSQFADQIGFSLAIFLQAIWFSFLHFQAGFPSGVVGIFLTLIFGVMMGYLAKQHQSIFVPVIIHFFADLSIFCLIVLRAKAIF